MCQDCSFVHVYLQYLGLLMKDIMCVLLDTTSIVKCDTGIMANYVVSVDLYLGMEEAIQYWDTF